MVNTPIPHSLKSEAKKAAKILQSFSIPNAKVGPDKMIPTGLIINAAGLAIITVAKIGFLVTARGGSGIVIAKLDNGEWSAPSAIGIAGLGGGLEIGAEVTDFVIILNTKSAVEAFSKGGNLTLGGNFTVAAGPYGRNVEGDVALRSTAAIYTYSKTKGLFAGISVEGSALIERKDANKKFYHDESIRAYDILGGKVEPPLECDALYNVLKMHKKEFEGAALRYASKKAMDHAEKNDETGIVAGLRSFGKSVKKPGSSSSTTEKTKGGASKDYCDSSDDEGYGQGASYNTKQTYQTKTVHKRTQSVKTTKSQTSMKTSSSWHSTDDIMTDKSQKTTSRKQQPLKATRHIPKSFAVKQESEWNKVANAKALFDFQGIMPYDLTFQKGNVIQILTRTDTQEDWWEGTLRGKTGIFPANYVKVA